MNKICLINQPAGLGDIIFCQKIGYYYRDKGYEIVWPIKEVYLKDVKKYIDSPFQFIPLLNTFQKKIPVFSDNFIYLPLDGSSRGTTKRIMEAKYDIAQIDYKDWINFFHIKRDINKEQELFNKLGLTDTDEYALINYNYASPPGTFRMYADLKNDNLKKIEMDFIEGYSIFDWCKVMEYATEICITDCAAVLLIEKIKPLKAKNMTVISRRPEFDEIKLMYNLNWDYVVGRKCDSLL